MTEQEPNEALATEISGGIVVGVDGSDQSMCAVVWAAKEAARRGVPLHLVTAYTIPIFAATSIDPGYAQVDDVAMREAGMAVLDGASARAREYVQDVDAHVIGGDASGVLLELSKRVDLIVVGSRGRGGFVGRLLGSVSTALPGHANCPTVVTPLKCAPRVLGSDVAAEDGASAGGAAGASSAGGDGSGAAGDGAAGATAADARADGADAAPKRVGERIVVGVDGSDEARYAALAAAEEARLHGLPLRVVCALPPFTGSFAWMPTALDREEIFRDIEVQLEAGKAWLTSHFQDVEVETMVVDGPPIEVLVAESDTAEMVVVGSRGGGGFAGMLLGSTSQAVLHHAKGPVMVVPDKEDSRLDDRQDFGPMLTKQ